MGRPMQRGTNQRLLGRDCRFSRVAKNQARPPHTNLKRRPSRLLCASSDIDHYLEDDMVLYYLGKNSR